jgi:hypothetical protein
MNSDNWTAAAFQQRRRETWKAIRIWLVVVVLALIGTYIALRNADVHASGNGIGSFRYNASLDDMTLWQLNLSLGSLLAMAVSVIAIVIAVQRHYRCPKCNAVPMSSWNTLGPGRVGKRWGVSLNPSVCPSCGAKLR